MHGTDTLEPIDMARPEPGKTRVDPSTGRVRKRGRPLEVSPAEVLRLIQLKAEQGALYRVHREHPGLYARARRLFGSWARAVTAAGVDHGRAVADARRRALDARRRARQGVAR